ncbi:MAG: hypothetical protein Q9167_004169 [Letrouitia subvulpina]
MAESRIVTVFGATGQQGGSVARSLLQNKANRFKVRAVTRKPESEASKLLASLGATVVKADGWDREEMIEAFNDPEGPTESDFGKNIVDSAAMAGVKHLVFSSGPPSTEMTGGKVGMKAMDMKNKIETYARSKKEFSTFTAIIAGGNLENLLYKEIAPVFGGFPHFPDPEGYLTYKTPLWGGEEDFPWISIADDFGDLVHGILLDPDRWNNKIIHGVSEILSCDKMATAFQEVTGKKSRYVPVLPSWEAFDTHGVPELEDIKNMFGFTQLTGGHYFGPCRTESATATILKKEAALARGKDGEDARLISVKQWFVRVKFV